MSQTNQALQCVEQASPLVAQPWVADYKAIPRTQIQWLWENRIPLGTLTFIVGEPGLGKGLLAIDLAARVTQGASWPGITESPAPLGKVLMLHGEDAQDSVVPNRLEAAGAQLDRVLTFVTEPVHAGSRIPRPFLLREDMPAMEAALKAHPDCRLIVVDPISAYLGDIDGNRNSEVRSLLLPLASLAKAYNVAVVCVAHLNKRSSPSAVNRVMGALSFVSAARTVWGVMRDPAAADQRLMLSIKSNVADENLGMRFQLCESESVFAPHLKWDREPVRMTFQSAACQQSRASVAHQEYQDNLNYVKESLREVLSDGPQGNDLVHLRVPGLRVSHYTAAAAIGVIKVKQGFYGNWVWMLPEDYPKWQAEQIEKQEREKQERVAKKVAKQRKARHAARREKLAKSDDAQTRKEQIRERLRAYAARRAAHVQSVSSGSKGFDSAVRPASKEDRENPSGASEHILDLMERLNPGIPPELAAERLRVQLQKSADEGSLADLEKRIERGRQRELDAERRSAGAGEKSGK